MKGLYRRGKVWWLKHSVEGRPLRQSLGTESESEAIELAAEIKERPLQDAGRWDYELTQYIANRTGAGRMSRSAAESRRAVLSKFGREMEVGQPSKVTADLAVRWYRKLQKTIAETTAQTYVRWLSTFLGALADERKLPKNLVPLKAFPFDRLKKSKLKKFCTRDEVRALVKAAETDQMRFILYCGFHAGLRRGEIAEARPEWFDLAAGLLHVRASDTWEPKDRDNRTIPLTKEFVGFLRAYGLPSPFMLPGKKRLKAAKGWRYRYDFRRPFTELVEKVGLPWVTPHTMRRTFASLLVSDGVSLYKVAIWLGDMERVVQDHYGYLLPKDSDIERAHAPTTAPKRKAA